MQTRAVTTPPSCGGAGAFVSLRWHRCRVLLADDHSNSACPPLTQIQNCNTAACPIDCLGLSLFVFCAFVSCANAWSRFLSFFFSSPRSVGVGRLERLLASALARRSAVATDAQLRAGQSCGPGKLTRTRSVTRAAANGGMA